MITVTDTLPPVISTGTYNELLDVKRLAREVYSARSNFTKLCMALEKLYEHFDEENHNPND
jgi:hypothetical protein